MQQQLLRLCALHWPLTSWQLGAAGSNCCASTALGTRACILTTRSMQHEKGSLYHCLQPAGSCLAALSSTWGQVCCDEDSLCRGVHPACHRGSLPLMRHVLDFCRKRLTSPERWEVNQLIKSGVLDVRDYPTFDDETGQVGWLLTLRVEASSM